jgi:hypothetical protein
MDRPVLTSREHLELLRSSAFESEHAWLYDTSYLQHEAAALALEQEIEQSYASISPDDNSDEQVRIIRTQINIHRERQRALRPHLESGSDQIDEDGNECVFVPAPNQWGANGDLDEESESLSAVSSNLSWYCWIVTDMFRFTTSSHGKPHIRPSHMPHLTNFPPQTPRTTRCSIPPSLPQHTISTAHENGQGHQASGSTSIAHATTRINMPCTCSKPPIATTAKSTPQTFSVLPNFHSHAYPSSFPVSTRSA